MGEHKGTITIILAVLVIFGIFIVFANEIIDPIIEKIGEKFEKLSDGVFKRIDDNSENILSEPEATD